TPHKHAALYAAGLLVVVLIVYLLGRSKAMPPATSIANSLGTARRLHNACLEKAQARHAQTIESIASETAERTATLEHNLRTGLEKVSAVRDIWPTRAEEKWRQLSQKNEEVLAARLEQAERDHTIGVERVTEEAASRQ